MRTNQVNWFEIAVSDLNRAKTFYQAVFGSQLTEMPMGPVTMAMFPWIPGGTNASGALVKGDNYTPSMTGNKIYFSCDDVNNELELITKNGGQIIVPKMNLGEFGNMALFADTEGNLIGLHSMK
jgi:predicted enzyme related to lactoylglutathione lyase